ncbi:hypothetical protein [Streptomyces chilikensis]|uniref:C2H2-type domain-containing protein n=1 Tax=Streptomyces chilikensis TaxID=1194079 RepID=A0ABV3EJE4_9ACTN
MHQYRCDRCATTSTSYVLRRDAEAHGQRHRDDHHGGDHPDGESILTEPLRLPERREWGAMAVVVALILIGLANKLW